MPSLGKQLKLNCYASLSGKYEIFTGYSVYKFWLWMRSHNF